MTKTSVRQLTRKDIDEIAGELLTEFAVDYADELDTVISWLREAASNPSAITDLIRYRHKPVSPREFVEGEAYMNKPNAMWPLVMTEYEELNSGKYVESVLTGGIGVGKTHLALYTQAYQLYLLSCMRDPHAEFDLDPTSEIVIIFQSLNLSLAQGVDYSRFRAMIESAPYFQKNFMFDTDVTSEMRFPKRIVVKPISGQETGAIGQNVIGGLIDEINFMAVTENSKRSRDGGTYDQAVQNYNSIARRRESRFMQLGSLPGMLCLVSSRNYPGQFTDKKEAEAREQLRRTGKTTIFIYDKRAWEVRPERFGTERFRVFLGDETRKPYIMPDDAVVPEKDEHLVMAIPAEYRHSFEQDILAAIRDIAGRSTMALHPFILNTEAVAACFGKVQSIASREDCDFLNTRVALYPNRVVNKDEPRFAHIDLAFARDSAGIAVGHVPGFKRMQRGDHEEILPIIHLDMILEVKPPKGGEIEFENLRKLMYTIRDKLGLPLKWVSFDGFQSRDSMQIMYQRGFIVGYQSMDDDTEAYDITKQAIYDGRLLAPAHPKAQRELTTLEVEPKKMKIDHPPHGSKDVSDAIAGVVTGLTIRREIWVRHKVPMHLIPNFLLNRKEPESATKVAKGSAVNFDELVHA